MGQRSQASKRERYGVDSSGWNGEPLPWPSVPPAPDPLGEPRLEAVQQTPTIDHPGRDNIIVFAYKEGSQGSRIPQPGVTVFGESSDRDVATSEGSDVTNALGQATLQLISIDPGTCTVTYSAAGYPNETISVTIN